MRRRRQREPDAEVTLGKRDSDTWQAVNGRVVSLLSDDEADERHQRLILDVRGGQTLLVAHNIDLANRVPVSLGDRLSLRGLFEWNPQGGLIHWTHHDPMGIEEGGFIEHNGKRYR
ncbi:MAG: DUF3465 domain-containing protein [Pseudomonadota bacterium]